MTSDLRFPTLSWWPPCLSWFLCFFFQAEDGIRDPLVTGVQTCALPICPVGWMDATEDGEFCVALRSALLRDREARLYAGVGVVAGSDPAAELAETEIKLGRSEERRVGKERSTRGARDQYKKEEER